MRNHINHSARRSLWLFTATSFLIAVLILGCNQKNAENDDSESANHESNGDHDFDEDEEADANASTSSNESGSHTANANSTLNDQDDETNVNDDDESIMSSNPVRVLCLSESWRIPLVQGISEDGKYVAHSAISVETNQDGEIIVPQDFRYETARGDTWEAGRVQTVQRTADGSTALVLSQRTMRPDKEGPFSKPFPEDFVQQAFGADDQSIVTWQPAGMNFQTEGFNFRIGSTLLGANDNLLVVAWNNDTDLARFFSVDLHSHDVEDTEREIYSGLSFPWGTVHGDPFFFQS